MERDIMIKTFYSDVIHVNIRGSQIILFRFQSAIPIQIIITFKHDLNIASFYILFDDASNSQVWEALVWLSVSTRA